MTSNGKILLVEDDPVTAAFYSKALIKNRFDVTVANDPRIALAIFEERDPDLLLLDYMLPDIDGIQLFGLLRCTRADYKPIPVILYTSAYSPRLVQQALQAGISQVIDKAKASPILVTGLIKTLLKVPA